MVPPTPNRLIRHRHSAFREQIFDVTQAEGKPEVEPYCLVNDLGRETIPAVADFLHPLGYSTTGRAATTTRRDNAAGDVSLATHAAAQRAARSITEVGVIAAQGPRHARELAELIEACDEIISVEVCEVLAPLVVQIAPPRRSDRLARSQHRKARAEG